jgi:hypothetical protein
VTLVQAWGEFAPNLPAQKGARSTLSLTVDEAEERLATSGGLGDPGNKHAA